MFLRLYLKTHFISRYFKISSQTLCKHTDRACMYKYLYPYKYILLLEVRILILSLNFLILFLSVWLLLFKLDLNDLNTADVNNWPTWICETVQKFALQDLKLTWNFKETTSIHSNLFNHQKLAEISTFSCDKCQNVFCCFSCSLCVRTCASTTLM